MIRAALILLALAATQAHAVTLTEVAERMDADVAAGKPLVVHVIVALCDNEFQGIVPVPEKLGNGADPGANLYWGAMYGMRGYFRHSSVWSTVEIAPSDDPRVLERVLYRREVTRGGKRVDVFVLAEAWKGRNIADAMGRFLEINRGQHVERVRLGDREISAGGAAHIVAFIGHNGLMDFEPPAIASTPGMNVAPRAAIVLACFSDRYFSSLLGEYAVPLLTTTGLMAPEAYTLDAALVTWFGGADAGAVREAAARAYARYQRIPENSARRLFLTHAGKP